MTPVPAPASTDAPAVEVRDLVKVHPARFRLFGPRRPPVRALRGVSLRVEEGETLGIIGESGSGKTTLARCLVGLTRPTSGAIAIGGRSLQDLGAGGPRAVAQAVQYVFQDPQSSLNPRHPVRRTLDAPLRFLAGLPADARETRARDLLEAVGLDRGFLDRYPHELSGGQAQRVGIARALAAGARVIVLDEPVSALDVSVQAQVLRLLAELRRTLGLTYLFISHDLAVVEAIAHRAIVLRAGEVVEEGAPDVLLRRPTHPYTRRLVASIPLLAAR
ncbi:ABC transporter ATP-binding protein [Chthonobacter rhizosphaerae]|uniref:ABC transporter ATP-binding protein n=1 Tax=Chthonobacter rhizosphaerae TaxID=2735553 RepID=UPI0015EF519C|nr:ATP-binding cassette domain-containing protein [Chthonobacter rhizosphaerae]